MSTSSPSFVQSLSKNATSSANKRQFLSFSLAHQAFAVPIEDVREITGIQKFTPVPDVKEFVRGVINLRGAIIPIIDIRMRLGLPEGKYGHRSCIVVVDLEGDAVGLLVDSVQEVANIDSGNIENPPKFDTSSSAQFINGIGKIGEEIRFILDVESIARH